MALRLIAALVIEGLKNIYHAEIAALCVPADSKLAKFLTSAAAVSEAPKTEASYSLVPSLGLPDASKEFFNVLGNIAV